MSTIEALAVIIGGAAAFLGLLLAGPRALLSELRKHRDGLEELRDQMTEIRDAVIDVAQSLGIREGSTMRRLRARQRRENAG